MEYYYVDKDKRYNDLKLKNTIITIGKFDGIHKGHQKLIDEIKRQHISVLVTFAQDDNGEYIYSEEEKREIISELGIDVMIVYPFNDTFKNIEAYDFIKDILIDKLGATKIVVGKDFKFGKNRLGDILLLSELSKEFQYEVVVCEKVRSVDGEEISSTLVRNYIKKSDMKKVSQLLGRNLSVRGVIVKGKQLGRTIGFPTININPPKNKMMPLNGVYKSEITFKQEKSRSVEVDNTKYKGLTNIGKRPTVDDGDKVNVETYIHNFNNDVYGRNVNIYLKEFLRKEKKFGSIEELKDTLEEDKKRI